MRLATITIVVRSDEEFTNITPSVSVEVEEGIPAVLGLAACVGGTKSALRALEEEYEKHKRGDASLPSDEELDDPGE
jgi:hypothetical protein